jgi:hypothetical protein
MGSVTLRTVRGMLGLVYFVEDGKVDLVSRVIDEEDGSSMR